MGIEVTGPYQFLPPLSEEDFAALKSDIAARGVLVPVECDEEGNVLDGHHRILACKELGIADWPIVTRSFASEADKRTHSRQLNLARRHLNRKQRRALIADELKDRPERSNRQVAADLGVSDHTIAKVRDDLEEGAQIAHLPEALGADGKLYKKPKKKPAKRGRPSKLAAARKKGRPKKSPSPPEPSQSPHERDMKMLRDIWDCACESARNEFLRSLGYEPQELAA